MRAWSTTTRVTLAIAAAVVLAAVVAVTASLLRPSAEPPGRAGGGPDPGTCTAAPGAEQQDVDPDDSPEAPWPHVRGKRVVVHIAAGGLPARYAGLVDQAAGIWARSPCVEAVVVDACPPESNCTTVVARERGRDDDTDGESKGDDRGGVRRSNTITLYTGLLDDASDNGALSTIVHEMGHALGLVHRNDPDSVMNAATNDSTDPAPDEIDFANLVVIYG